MQIRGKNGAAKIGDTIKVKKKGGNNLKKILAKKESLVIARIKNGMTTVALAKKCGITGSAIRMIEGRTIYASPSTAKAITEALSIPFDELFDIVDGDGE